MTRGSAHTKFSALTDAISDAKAQLLTVGRDHQLLSSKKGLGFSETTWLRNHAHPNAHLIACHHWVVVKKVSTGTSKENHREMI